MYKFSQIQIFLIFTIIGLILGLVFDFFRSIRKSFKVSDFMTNMQDIIFMAFTRNFNNLYINLNK